MSVAEGRELYEQQHPKRGENREKLPEPKSGDKGVQAGRALYDNNGKRSATYDA